MRRIRKIIRRAFELYLLLTIFSHLTQIDSIFNNSNIEKNTFKETEYISEHDNSIPDLNSPPFYAEEIPEYNGAIAVEINDNMPFFAESEYVVKPFEYYSELDALGRCGTAYANICTELMPTEERQAIGQIKPSGWHTIKYNGIVDGNYLYNRCHLIGFQLCGENANEKNLITGTRYFNVDGMEPYENKVAKYIKNTNHHALYRVTPIFNGNELIARGVLMECASVEDDELRFCVFVYNVQPGINIDYVTGESSIQ